LLDPLPSEEVLFGLLGRARLAVGTRYHQAVLASARGVPALGIYGDAYTKIKMQGLAAMAPGRVSAVPARAPAEVLIRESTDLVARGRSAPLQAHRLPEIDLLLNREPGSPP
jgi:hypothetical protein